MKKSVLWIVGMLWAFTSFSQTNADNILGKWTNEAQSHVWEIVQAGESIEALIVKSDIPEYIGKKQITGLEYQKAGTYSKGEIHIFKKDETLDCSVKLLDERRMEVTVKKGVFSQSSIWTRVTDNK